MKLLLLATLALILSAFVTLRVLYGLVFRDPGKGPGDPSWRDAQPDFV